MHTQALEGLTGLTRLVYASRFTGRLSALDEAVRQILQKSIQNNRICDVTGLLLVHDGWFVQALEGPAASVRETYDRIAADPRHDQLTLLGAGPATARLFRDWNMSARTVARGQSPILMKFGPAGEFTPSSLSGEQATELLTEVGRAHAA